MYFFYLNNFLDVKYFYNFLKKNDKIYYKNILYKYPELIKIYLLKKLKIKERRFMEDNRFIREQLEFYLDDMKLSKEERNNFLSAFTKKSENISDLKFIYFMSDRSFFLEFFKKFFFFFKKKKTFGKNIFFFNYLLFLKFLKIYKIFFFYGKFKKNFLNFKNSDFFLKKSFLINFFFVKLNNLFNLTKKKLIKNDFLFLIFYIFFLNKNIFYLKNSINKKSLFVIFKNKFFIKNIYLYK